MPRRDAAPVVVFDLDGTVLGVNSFPRWVLFLILGHVAGIGIRHRLLLSLRALRLLLQRKLTRSSHDVFLWRLQDAWRWASGSRPNASLRGFEATLLKHVRPNMGLALELAASGRIDAVLATAAAEEYAAGLGRRLGFRHVLATVAGRRCGEPANCGAHKRQRVLTFLAGRDWQERPLILVTDHLDDLPLMRDSSAVYWCGPADALQTATATASDVRFIACRELSACALAQQLSDACQTDTLRSNAFS